MKTHSWKQIPEEQLGPGIVRQVIHADRITIARLSLAKGSIVRRHVHHNEQITMLESGRLRFLFDDGEQIIEGGQMLQIPGDAPHAVEALEDSVATDLFAPVREDWIRGEDAYLRQS